MNREDALKRISKVVAGQLSLDESEIQEGSSFTADLGADSLDTVELIMQFEEEFGIEIPDEDAEGLLSVGQAVDYISTKLN